MHPFLILLIGVLAVVGSILALRLHAFLALILGALVVAAITPRENVERYATDAKLSEKAAKDLAQAPWGKRLGDAFGRSCANIAIIIAMAAIVGQCMLESGGAERIVRASLNLTGEKGAPIALAVTGFILGIPVFFDTVFYLMIPLAKALAARTGKNYGLYVMSIAAGATISHSLVPPTPGPLYVATELGVLGPMILAGCVIGGLSVVPGVAYAYFANRRWPVPLRETADVSIDDLKAMSARDTASLPSLSASLFVILFPVALIVADVVLGLYQKDVPSWLLTTSRQLGDPNIALGLSAGVALILRLRHAAPGSPKLAATLETALAGAGQIILITASGAAFGAMLQQTAVGGTIAALPMFKGASPGLAVLAGAFLVTSLIRIAQGSATVAMVTSIGMFGALAKDGALGFHPVYLALAIGFGSKPVPWMNDSGFWLICKMSGQTPTETLRNHSAMFTIMGVSGLIFTMISAKLFPFTGTP
ncbi:MAG TPA: SLC13 family permease [Planctomycetota bacterium]